MKPLVFRILSGSLWDFWTFSFRKDISSLVFHMLQDFIFSKDILFSVGLQGLPAFNHKVVKYIIFHRPYSMKGMIFTTNSLISATSDKMYVKIRFRQR